VLLGLATLADERVAFADPTKAQCVESDTAAQNERRAGHLVGARRELEVCSHPACPKLVRDDCTERLTALDAQTPTLVFAVKDAAGEDVIGVRVSVDGAPPIELPATAVPVDPGVHTFRFVADGASPVQKKLVVRESEKDRKETITLGDVHVPAGHPGSAAPAPPSSSSTWVPQKTAAVVLGGVGVVGVIVGAVMGGLSFSAWSSSKSECSASACNNRTGALSDHDSAVTDATVSDVGFILGGALVATGVVVYLTAPSGTSASSSSGAALRFVPSASPGGGGVRLEGRF
jgi:hypothetical protein